MKRVHCAGPLLAVVLLAMTAPASLAGLKDDLSAAEALMQRGDRKGAAEAFLSIIQSHGEEAEVRTAFYHMADLSTDGVEYVRFLDLFLEHGGRKDKRGAEVELMAGRFYFTQGDYRTALRRFESARDISRGDPAKREASYWIGLSLVALHEFVDARSNLNEAVAPAERGEVTEEALFALGELERSAGDFAAAAAAYQACLAAFPAGDYAPAALLGESAARSLLGEESASLDLLRRLVADFPDTPEAATARGRVKIARPAGPSATPDRAAPRPAPTAETGYGVQVGAFAQETNARKLADDLNRLGYAGVRIDRGTENDRLFHVRFGPFPDQERAERAGELVSSTLGLRYQIVPPETAHP